MAVAAKAALGAGRDPCAGDLGDRARGEVEDDRVGRGQLGERAHRAAGLDRAAVLANGGREGVGDRLRPAARDRPAVTVAGGDQRQPDRRAEGPGQGAEGVGGDAAEQRPRLMVAEQARHHGRRQRRPEPEARQPDRVPRHPRERQQDVLAERVEPRRGGAEDALPGPARTPRAPPRSPRSSASSARRCRRRAGGRARPRARPTRGRGARARAGAAPARRRPAGGSPSSRRGPGRAASARCCGRRRRSSRRPRSRSPGRPAWARVAAQARPFGPAPTTIASLIGRRHSWTGNGRPSSQGCWVIMSATRTWPSSISPVAASKIR